VPPKRARQDGADDDDRLAVLQALLDAERSAREVEAQARAAAEANAAAEAQARAAAEANAAAEAQARAAAEAKASAAETKASAAETKATTEANARAPPSGSRALLVPARSLPSAFIAVVLTKQRAMRRAVLAAATRAARAATLRHRP
jgi:hypothetical protein